MLLQALAVASRSPFFPAPSSLQIPWYSSFNVVSSTFDQDDCRYTPPLKRLSPKSVVKTMHDHFDVVTVRKPSIFLPTEAHFVLVHGKLQFYDDVYFRFEHNRTHIVSASRVGVYDLNVNANRVGRIRKLLKQ